MKKVYLLEEIQELANAQSITELDVDKVYVVEVSDKLPRDHFNNLAKRLHETLEQLGIRAVIIQLGVISSIKGFK